MDKKTFSYSLFEAKQLPQHRFWDRWKKDKERYWYNLLSLPLTNRILFPEYHMVFYVSPNIWENPLSQILKILANGLDKFEVHTINLDYSLTEPAIWRMMPLWHRDTGVFHPRDIDSLPSRKEVLYVDAFEKSDCTVGTIRSHENHHGIACQMLAGLSSFKPQDIPLNIKGPDFNYYYSQRHSDYGSDQDLVVNFFTKAEEFTGSNFLDYKIDKQFHDQLFSCCSLDDTTLTKSLTPQKEGVINKIESLVPTSWLGEPCDTRGEYTSFLLSHFLEIDAQIRAVPHLVDFYKIDT